MCNISPFHGASWALAVPMTCHGVPWRGMAYHGTGIGFHGPVMALPWARMSWAPLSMPGQYYGDAMGVATFHGSP